MFLPSCSSPPPPLTLLLLRVLTLAAPKPSPKRVTLFENSLEPHGPGRPVQRAHAVGDLGLGVPRVQRDAERRRRQGRRVVDLQARVERDGRREALARHLSLQPVQQRGHLLVRALADGLGRQREVLDRRVRRALVHERAGAEAGEGVLRLLDVFAQPHDALGLRLEEVQRLDGDAAHEGRRRGAEDVAGAAQALVVHHLGAPDADAADAAEAVRERREQHLGGRDGHLVVLAGAAAGVAEHAEAEGVVEDEAVLEALLEPHDRGQVADVAAVLEEPFRHDEAPVPRRVAPQLLVLLLHLQQLQLQIAHVVVLVAVDVRAAEAHARPDGLVAGLVHHEDVAALREGRDGGRHRRRGVAVHDALVGAEEPRHLGLDLHVHVEGAVESARAAAAAPIVQQRQARLFLVLLLLPQAQEVEARKVHERFAVARHVQLVPIHLWRRRTKLHRV
mmetsp:Transcript_32871/g.104064  ORF Transcript_32871/g.104064 Transcript_32871/m.104064 type:complete len:448 (-) Transcript_32871:111-1454(-)